ncbi:MAG: hypothetical protein JWO22_2732 [Frankiales bacterium]|nr:hypothetical protein [Frankiales bacterium]
MQAPLSQNACRDRLVGSRRGFLACSRGALPTVLPVTVRTEQGQLFVLAGLPELPEQLGGQVVALTVGRSAFRFRRGWTVTARGRLGEPRPDGSVPLEIAQLEGVTAVHPQQRTYP